MRNFINTIQKIEYSGISIDTRTLQKGDIFFAIGDRGHSFVEEAFLKGAVAAVVTATPEYAICNKKTTKMESLIIVRDTLEALMELGSYIKSHSSSNTKIIAITGSVGKTTTKVWLSEILKHKHSVLTGIKNYNTIYGLPICLSMLNKSHEYGIFEIGSNSMGEIKKLSTYLKPDIAVITNIKESHIGRFGTRENLATEKISIIDGLSEKGTIVFGKNCEFGESIIKKAIEKGVKIVIFETKDYQKIEQHYNEVCSCVMAILVEAIGLKEKEYLPYISELKPLQGRGAIETYSYNDKTFKVIDDTYNASPSSMLASLSYLKNTKNRNKKIAILGEMKELGDFSCKYHKEIAKNLKNIDMVFFVGSLETQKIMKKYCKNTFFEINEESIKQILSFVQNNDIILIKGSRSIALEKILTFCKK
ncbi:MAG: hypothetical protein LBI26_02735 [Holosporales bacterium]|jgi:UDP-N-acetylmuramoyl-tripeptide--D-alanyl-D-alanine ligase|nr:hypothetical protein [Holosporales bacterium]